MEFLNSVVSFVLQGSVSPAIAFDRVDFHAQFFDDLFSQYGWQRTSGVLWRWNADVSLHLQRW
ncbi:MAG: hypothetical protein ABJM63_04535, partial [Anderseniella sp.]